MAPRTNTEIVEAIQELALLYELDGASAHRVNAYRKAAKTLAESTVSIAQLVTEGGLTDLPGIGATLAEKITAFCTDGEIPAAVELKEVYPEGLLALTKLPGLGPKRAKLMFSELGIDSPQRLKEAAEAGQLSAVKGLGAKFEQSMLTALERQQEAGPARIRLDRAEDFIEPLLVEITKVEGVVAVDLAGSVRRLTESVADVNIAVSAEDPQAVVAAIAQLPLFESVQIDPTGTAINVKLYVGLDVQIKATTAQRYGNLLQYLTGSKAHNDLLQERAQRAGFELTDSALVETTGGRELCFSDEAGLYKQLGCEPIPPELREGGGELAAAESGSLPKLLELGDLLGDLHTHTVASDGRNTIEEMVAAARDCGYRYLVITDHSASHGFGNAVSADELKRQIERVRLIDQELEDFDLLIGSEVNILVDGSLDYEDDLLAQLDWVIASVHTSFSLDHDTMTARICTALEHPCVDQLGHPTGRLIERRIPYSIDIEQVIDTAAKTGVFLEINANPQRRDLSEVHTRLAADAGVPIVINSDAHNCAGLQLARYGVATARRAWLTADQVANTLPWQELKARSKRGVAQAK